MRDAPDGPRRTRLNEALEKASSSHAKQKAQEKDQSDDEWEEDDGVSDEENYCNHDITLDLNEPHSQSGRYWKEEFEKYQQDAKMEMGKLLKYKQLAKSYAQAKDAEAIDLAEKLRDEQQKVIKMENKIAESTADIFNKHENPGKEAPAEVVEKLSKQTALAVQYRQRVQELEDQLENFLQDKQDEATRRRQLGTSPRTAKTLVETQRELRKARSQLQEMDGLREQVSTLKDQLKASEKQAAKAEVEAKSDDMETSRIRDLRAQLRESKGLARQKENEMAKLTAEFEAFRQQTEAQQNDTKEVLERANKKIADLKKEVKTLKTTRDASRENHNPVSTEQRGAEEDDPVVKITSRALGGKRARQVSSENEGAAASQEKRRTLREKYRDLAPAKVDPEPIESPKMSGALLDKPDLEKPKWQPFVPRSPRNRAFLDELMAKKIANGGVTPAENKFKDVGVDDLSVLASKLSRKEQSEDEEDAKLPSRKTSESTVGNASKSRLPPERRAAALAKIEKRRLEKQKAKGTTIGKENVEP